MSKAFIVSKVLRTNHSAIWVALFASLFLMSPCFSNPDVEQAMELFKTGQYESCIVSVRKAEDQWQVDVQWPILLIKSLMAVGQYDKAANEAAFFIQEYFPLNLSLLKTAHSAFEHNNQADLAKMILQRIHRIAQVRSLETAHAADLVAVGQALLIMGGEPRLILDECYNRAIQKDPNCLDAYLAIGELALAKQDFELAADQYRLALKRFGANAEAYYGLARAFYHSNRTDMIRSLDAALVINAYHAGSLILMAEHEIDAENYPAARALLERIITVNPWHPKAWALHAVIAHLTNDSLAAVSCRDKALRFWIDNPRVDHLIGRKLSQNYWFAQGARYQESALGLDAMYLPALAQLAEDLLRLGDEKGWGLVQMVYNRDQYNIQAYNLVNLHDHMATFKTLSEDNLIMRMDPVEAQIYGDRVMALLKRAQAALCKKYGLELNKPVTLELFKNQQDFAVRTFGMPGGDGFLGVCFGDVITANSPKLTRQSNWEATLWHEFCHVVTLNLTHHKMPRWLSEGISVYEEQQSNPTWGRHMNPQYRRMIMEGGLTPISQLSGAFLNAHEPVDLQFAYYESSLVVEFLVKQYGLETIKAILADLGQGQEINSVLEKHTVPMDIIEEQFEAFARQRAESLAPNMDWNQPDINRINLSDIEAMTHWLDRHPNNFWGLTLLANQYIATCQWQEAKVPLQKLIQLYPGHTEHNNAYTLLARVHRELDETDQEYQVLTEWARHSADTADAYVRLMQIDLTRKDWDKVLEHGQHYLSVYPMLGEVHQHMGLAHEVLGHTDQAISSYQRLLLLDPADPVDIHYRLARLCADRQPVLARQYVLEALADAPRFRAAHNLLLQLRSTSTGQGDNP